MNEFSIIVASISCHIMYGPFFKSLVVNKFFNGSFLKKCFLAGVITFFIPVIMSFRNENPWAVRAAMKGSILGMVLFYLLCTLVYFFGDYESF